MARIKQAARARYLKMLEESPSMSHEQRVIAMKWCRLCAFIDAVRSKSLLTRSA